MSGTAVTDPSRRLLVQLPHRGGTVRQPGWPGEMPADYWAETAD
ncbi:hypothetical protein ACWEV4_20475 [Streptomyces sp. NPDC003860]